MEFSAADELHLVQYDDGETKWHAIRLEESDVDTGAAEGGGALI